MLERDKVEKLQPESFPTDGLTPEEDNALVTLLSKWNGGKISTPVFTELARMIPQPIVEVVICRRNGGTIETLLIPRPEDDIVWRGMIHSPGTALRRADFKRADKQPLNGAFDRIQNNEIKNRFTFLPIFVARLHGDDVNRGPTVSEIYYTEIPPGSDQKHYTWYPVNQLAQNPRFIQSQLRHVELAAEQYSKRVNLDSL